MSPCRNCPQGVVPVGYDVLTVSSGRQTATMTDVTYIPAWEGWAMAGLLAVAAYVAVKIAGRR